MTATRPTSSARRAVEDAQAGTYTGVAQGSLGTAANLEDTQVYEVDDLQAPAPTAAPVPYVAPPPAVVPAPPAAPEPSPDVVRAVAPVDRAAPAPAVLRRTPVASSGRSRFRPLTGGALAAAVLVAVVGVWAVFALGGAGDRSGTAPGADAPTVLVTQAPATEPAGGAGGGGKGHGNGNGKGHGNGD